LEGAFYAQSYSISDWCKLDRCTLRSRRQSLRRITDITAIWDDGPRFGVYLGPRYHRGIGTIGMLITTDRIGVTTATMTTMMMIRRRNKSNAKWPRWGHFF
jgi:hypothetical protein